MAVYLDSSALLKLLVVEAESDRLRAWLAERPARTSTALVQVEVLRAVRRHRPDAIQDARRMLERLVLVAADDQVLAEASRLDPPGLHSLDAIHLATALRLGSELEALITYDRRMIEGAALLQVPVVSPA